MTSSPSLSSLSPPLWQPLFFGAMAGGMGWGIRGQYGHETGAMIAGLLVGLVMALLFRPQASALSAARAVGWCAVAIGFGGSMTYGQTIGLTQNPSMIGNWAALGWGMLGLAIKGAIWIGFAGAFLGMGLSGVPYRSRELLGLMLALLGLFAAGVWLINSPFDPERKVLPAIYFSADWRWEPGAVLKPRREVWGGLLLALAGLIAYTGLIRRDMLARRLALWAMLGGAIGFPLGQSLQAFHAWNPELFKQGFWLRLDPHLNWWNNMETTFGAVAGAAIGLGLWLNRRRIAPLENPGPVTLHPGLEWPLLGLHAVLLITSEFDLWPPAAGYSEYSLILGLIPVVAIAWGRWWPFMLVLPVTLGPIAGKTLRQLVYNEHQMEPWIGWMIYVAAPLAAAAGAALYFGRRWQARDASFLRGTLLLAAWLYFGLNYAFFHFPWPWAPWTGRTPNGMVYILCALGLSTLALMARGRESTVDPMECGGKPDASAPGSI